MLETGEVEDTSCVLANATYAGRILHAGEGHMKPNADQCWQACKWGLYTQLLVLVFSASATECTNTCLPDQLMCACAGTHMVAMRGPGALMRRAAWTRLATGSLSGTPNPYPPCGRCGFRYHKLQAAQRTCMQGLPAKGGANAGLGHAQPQHSRHAAPSHLLLWLHQACVPGLLSPDF